MYWLAPAIIVLFLSAIAIIFGIGGASIAIPIFYFMGMEISQARFAGLVIVMVSSAVAGYAYLGKKMIARKDIEKASIAFIAMMAATPAGALLASALDERSLVGLFSLALFASAAMVVFGKKISCGRADAADEKAAKNSYGIKAAVFQIGGGIAAGLANGALGIGGGVFLVPAFVMAGEECAKAAILSVICMFFASILAFASNAAYIEPDFSLLVPVAIAAAIGAYFGANLIIRKKVDSKTIEKFLPAVLVLFAIKLAIDFLN
jgi:uncharacterized membrane protein YfcA